MEIIFANWYTHSFRFSHACKDGFLKSADVPCIGGDEIALWPIRVTRIVVVSICHGDAILDKHTDVNSRLLFRKPVFENSKFWPLGDVRRIGTLVNSSPYSAKKKGRNENMSQKCKQTSDSRKNDRISVFKLFLVAFRFVYFFANIFVSPFFSPNWDSGHEFNSPLRNYFSLFSFTGRSWSFRF